MKKLYSCLLILCILLLVTEGVYAQRSIGQYRGNINAFNKNRRYWSFGGGIHAMNYFGDLAPKNRIASTDISFTRPGIGITGQYRLNPSFSFRASFMYGRLKGNDNTSELNGDDPDDGYRYVRNQHFRNDIKELSAVMVWDLKKHTRTFITRPEFIPYLFAGIAVFHHNPKAQVPTFDAVHYSVEAPSPIVDFDPRYQDGKGNNVSPEDWIALKPLRTEGNSYSNFAFAIPVGAGVRYKVNRYWDLSFEISYHQTFSDYVDDVSTYYLNPEDFGTGPQANLSRIMAYRSNELKNLDAVNEDVRFRFRYTEDNDPIYSAHQWENPMEDPTASNYYQHFAGYGVAHPENIRGKDDKDVYLVTSISLTYILGTNLRNARFR